jgi:hypothetical protein
VAANNTYQYLRDSFDWLFIAAVINTVKLHGLKILWLDCDNRAIANSTARVAD